MNSYKKYTNITTKLKRNLFTKVIKRSSEEALVGQTESLIKREKEALLFIERVENAAQKGILIIDPKIIIV